MSRGGVGTWGVGMSIGEGMEAWEVCHGVGPEGRYVKGWGRGVCPGGVGGKPLP